MERVDPEIAAIAGPSLVAPILNPRFAPNAANARWGSLRDALSATDAPGPQPKGPLDPARAAAAWDRTRALLDDALPLAGASRAQAEGFAVEAGALVVRLAQGTAGLAGSAGFAGYAGPETAPTSAPLRRHGLHLELRIDPDSPAGGLDPAGVADVVLESAPTAIMDLEDSIAAVDAADKTAAYRVWLRPMLGTLSVEVPRAGRAQTRRMAQDRAFTAPDGATLTLRGRALMLVRTVGHLMTTPAVLDHDGAEAFEGIEDRATCRICSQHVATRLRRVVVAAGEVEAALRRMAEKLDAQNAGDPACRPTAPGFDGPASLAARALAFDALGQPSGYTEPLLRRWRAARKAMDAGPAAA